MTMQGIIEKFPSIDIAAMGFTHAFLWDALHIQHAVL